jgi:hypothetical protein
MIRRIILITAGTLAALVTTVTSAVAAEPGTPLAESAQMAGLTTTEGWTVAGVMVIITGLAAWWGKVKYGHAAWFLALGLMLGTTGFASCTRTQVNKAPGITNDVTNGVTTGGNSAGAGGH